MAHIPDVQTASIRFATKLAAAADVDPRTALKALVRGLESIRSCGPRERLAAAAPALGVVFPTAAPSSPPKAA